jgi:hypothetical protein
LAFNIKPQESWKIDLKIDQKYVVNTCWSIVLVDAKNSCFCECFNRVISHRHLHYVISHFVVHKIPSLLPFHWRGRLILKKGGNHVIIVTIVYGQYETLSRCPTWKLFWNAVD